MLLRQVLGSALFLALFWHFALNILSTAEHFETIFLTVARKALLLTLWLCSAFFESSEDHTKLIVAHLISHHNMKEDTAFRTQMSVLILQHTYARSNAFLGFDLLDTIYRTTCQIWLVSGYSLSVKLSSWVIFHLIKTIASG